MIKSFFIAIYLSFLFASAHSQDKIYTESGGEFIFSSAEVIYNGRDLPMNLRFTMFFHLNERVHFNFSNNVGAYTGLAVRNIGFITEYDDAKMKRRTYSLGAPLALKIGSFRDHLYIYGGGSYELFFHYKQKLFIDGNKNKFSEWFSPRTERFAPAFFGGIQFPGGINLQFKYYPNDFLNKDFKGFDFGQAVDYSNFTKSRMFYISISFYLPNKKIDDIDIRDSRDVRMALND